jgi:DNA-binding GntR family transcriptional regulator
VRSPKRHDPLYEQIYEILWDKIIAGEIRPRERLRDVDWAAQLQVSRTPVREALRMMEHEGVLIALAHGGYEVRQVHPVDLIALYRCRAVLEGLAAREAAVRLSDAALAELEWMIEPSGALIVQGAFARSFQLNTDFHDRLVAASGNAHLVRLLQSLRRMILFIRSSLMNEVTLNERARADYAAHLERTHRHHRGLLEALRAHDAERADGLMRAHLFQTAQDMDDVLRQIGTGPRTGGLKREA